MRRASRSRRPVIASRSARPIRASRSERASQAKGINTLAHEGNHIRDVLLDRKPQLLGTLPEVLALDSSRECLVLHPLDHRLRLQIEDALARTHERRGRDEPGHLVARKQRPFERALARHAAVLGMRENRADHPFLVPLLAKNLRAAKRMIFLTRPPLVVEVVKQRDGAPCLFVLAELA